MRERVRIARSRENEVKPQSATRQTADHAVAEDYADGHKPSPTTHSVNNVPLLHLQRTHGNHYVRRVLAPQHTDQTAQTDNAAEQFTIQRTGENRFAQRMMTNQTATGAQETVQRGWLGDAWDAVTDTVSDAAGAVADTAGDAWDAVTDTVSDTAGAVADTAGDAWDSVSDTAGGVWQGIKDTASGAWNAVTDTASNIWEGTKGVAGKIWEGISGAASTAWEALSDGARTAWDGVVKAAEAVGGLASEVWEGIKGLGADVWEFLSKAGAEVWKGLKWFGAKAVEILKTVGTFLWEKICFYGDTLWTFISNIPIRLWRIIVDGWDAIVGVLSWLGAGAGGFLKWLGEGLAGGGAWILDFIADPSLDKLGQAVKGFLKWAKDGGIGALSWLWDGIKGGAAWAGTVAMHVLELAGLFEGLSLIWGTIFHLRPLNDNEKAASQSIHGAGQIPYDKIWIDEKSPISFAGGAWVTTMHIIHSPDPGSLRMDIAVHELTHVAQYEKVGAIYMAQAVHAQIAGSKYDYGDLTGQHFANLDREAQAELCDNYYSMGGDLAPAGTTKTTKGGTVNTVEKFRPLIAEMRAGKY